MRAKESTASEDRSALVALALLVLGIVVYAAWAPWHTPLGVDNRSYLDMIEGIRRHGVPFILNGPASQFAELRPRFLIERGDELWGIYPPLYPYLAAPAMALGGAHLVYQLNVVLLAVLALTTFALAQALSDRARVGVVAAYLLLGTTSLYASQYQTLAQPLLLILLTGCAWAVVRSLRATRPARSLTFAALAGLAAGLGCATHLIAFPMSAAILLLLFACRITGATEGGAPGAALAFDLTPTRAPSARLAVALVPLALCLIPLSLFNHFRWGAWNPLSYGPCVWRACADFGKDAIHSASVLTFAAPALAWGVPFATALFFARKRRAAVAIVVLGFALTLVAVPLVRQRAGAIFLIGYGYVFDVSWLGLEWPFVRFRDGLGECLGGYAVKSLLQCSPAFATMLVAGRLPAPTRQRALFLGAPVAALFAALSLLANLPTAWALGYPYMFMRYCTPALPFLAIVTSLVLFELLDRCALPAPIIAAAIATVALIVGLWLGASDDDTLWSHRVVLLRVSLLVALIAAGSVAYAARDSRLGVQRAAASALAVAIGLGGAVSVVVDARRMCRTESSIDEAQEALAAVTPARFALMGFPVEMDPVLALRGRRDMEVADLWETEDWAKPRALMSRWEAEGRPIFALKQSDADMVSPWPDVHFEAVDPKHGIYRAFVAPKTSAQSPTPAP